MTITNYIDIHSYTSQEGLTSHVYLMDCIEALKQIPNKNINIAAVDPPYGLNKSSTHGRGKLKNRTKNTRIRKNRTQQNKPNPILTEKNI